MGLEAFRQPLEKTKDTLLTPNLSEKEREAVEELKKPAENIIRQLWNDINTGAYSLVISDEASGRIPALMVGNIIKEVCEKRGASGPLFRPLAGIRNLKTDERNEKVAALTKQIGETKKTLERSQKEVGKVLVVTDLIARGDAITAFSDALHSNRLTFDVATVGLAGIADIPKLSEKWNARVVCGSRTTPKIWADTNAKKLSGVQKDPQNIFPVPRSDIEEEKLRDARNLAAHIAHSIAVTLLREQETVDSLQQTGGF